MTETIRGYLVVKVLEAAGHTGEDVRVWDASVKDAFVKGERRARARPRDRRADRRADSPRPRPACARS